MGFIDRLKEFLAGSTPKALLEVKSDVSVESGHKAERDQIKSIKKNGSVNITNITYNFTLPPNFQDDTSQFIPLQKEMLKQFQSGDIQFVSKESDADITGYRDFEASTNAGELIAFFKEKIPEIDLQLLRVGLYVKFLSEKGSKEEALRVKDGAIRGRQRARNIINLASAGYFESYIRPIFENNIGGANPKEEYEEAVTYMPETVFVHNNMKAPEVLSEIEKRMEQREKYHMQVKCIMVNGLNSCVKIIYEVEATMRKEHPECNISVQTNGSVTTLLRCKMRIELPELDNSKKPNQLTV